MRSLLSLLLVVYTAHGQQSSSSSSSSQSTPNSPCPNVFMYEPPGSEPGRWYGVVTLSTDITLHGLWLNIVLDGKADILGNWVGDVTTTDNIDFKIENTKMKIQPGPAQAVRFFVQYNQLSKVPRLQAIRLNGREICNANTPIPAIDGTDNTAEDFTPRPLGDVPNRHDTATQRPSRPDSATQRPSRPDSGTQRPNRVDSATQRPNRLETATQRTSRPDYATQKPNRNEYVTQQPSRQNTQRPVDVVSVVVPQDLGQGPVIRPEDRPQTRPVQGRPSDSNGPVYVPSSRNPPIDETNANPYSISSGQAPSQSVTQRAPSRRPSYEEPDFTDDSSPGGDDDYFNGGLPTIVNVTGWQTSNQGTGGNRNQPQCGKVLRNANPNPLVVNGKPTLEGQWPWQIALYQTQTVDSKYICGGTLVTRNHVITAAHCVTRKGSSRVVNKNTLTVYLGKHNLRTSVEGVQIRLVAEILVHYQYNASSFSKDAGILKLREAAQFSEWVQAACLWPENQIELSYVIGKRGAVVGWGFDDKGVATEELTLVEMPVVDQETCIRSYSEFFARFTSDSTFCAGYRDGTSVCNGDSGGGMVFRIQDSWHLRGLVSLSVARQNEYRCDPTHYVVFTDLAKFLPWIKQTIGSDV